jgi:predicted nucleic acid-binding Zn ribbon protein
MDSACSIPTYQYQITETHKDQEIYHNYQDFEPERFSPAREEDKKKNF